MDYINKTFTSNSDGSIIRIVEQISPDIVAMDNGQRMSISRLIDPTFFTENIDASTFFNRDSNVYQSFINTIKSIPDSHISDTGEAGTKVIETGVYTENTPKNAHADKFYNNTEEVPVYHEDPEEEKRLLLAKYSSNNTNLDAIKRQAEKLKDHLDDEAVVKVPPTIVNNLEEEPVTKVFVNNEPMEEAEKKIIQPSKPQNTQFEMFKGIKRNTDFKVTLDISNKIPRPDFISMWEDSYEASIIDYLADEFTNALLSNPQYIKDQIITQLKESVYGKEIKKDSTKKVRNVKPKVENQITSAIKKKNAKKIQESQ